MKTSDAGASFIIGHEGVVTRAYRDPAGVITIGIGHTAAAGPPTPTLGMTITRAEAEAIFRRDLAKHERRVSETLGAVRQHVFDGAVSFDFNTGAIHRASWVAAWRAGDMAAVRDRLRLWTKAGGRELAGLRRRREAEADLIIAGRYGAGDVEDDVRALQRDLAALGFPPGAIDGIAGPATRAAVTAYQRQHPDLVADGIAGPATRASIARDLAARRAAGGAGGLAGGAATAAVVAMFAGTNRLVPALAIAAALLVLGGIACVAVRYRGELRRLFMKGT